MFELNKTVFLWIFVVLLATAIILSIIGERTLSLFGGNRDLAGQCYATIYTLLAGGMFICLLPNLTSWFVTIARRLFDYFGINFGVAKFVFNPTTPNIVANITFWIMIIVGILTIVAAVNVWNSWGQS